MTQYSLLSTRYFQIQYSLLSTVIGSLDLLLLKPSAGPSYRFLRRDEIAKQLFAGHKIHRYNSDHGVAQKIPPMGETFHAVFENGVLRPLRRLRLKQKSRVLVTLYPEPRWRSDFERLLTRMKSRTKAVPQEAVEAEIARARDEVKTKRRAARRSA